MKIIKQNLLFALISAGNLVFAQSCSVKSGSAFMKGNHSKDEYPNEVYNVNLLNGCYEDEFFMGEIQDQNGEIYLQIRKDDKIVLSVLKSFFADCESESIKYSTKFGYYIGQVSSEGKKHGKGVYIKSWDVEIPNENEKVKEKIEKFNNLNNGKHNPGVFKGLWIYDTMFKGRKDYKNGDIFEGISYGLQMFGLMQYKSAEITEYHGFFTKDVEAGEKAIVKYPNGGIWIEKWAKGNRIEKIKNITEEYSEENKNSIIGTPWWINTLESSLEKFLNDKKNKN